MKAILLPLLLIILGTPALAAPLTSEEQQQARQLFVDLGCRACHDFEKSGATLARSLDRIGLKLDQKTILQRLQQLPEQLGEGDMFMPSYRTTPRAQLELLSHFLAERK